MADQNLQKNDSDNESNDKDEDLPITNSFSNLDITTKAVHSVVPQTSPRDTLHKFLTTTATKGGLIKQYKAPVPKIIFPNEPKSTNPVVLCVFLGPSYDTRAGDGNADPDWNPFTHCKGGWTKSIHELGKRLPLNEYFLVDAFPLLFWDKGKSPNKDNYVAHFNLGVEYIRHIIKVISPRFVLAFGRQSGWVTYVATGIFHLVSPSKKAPIVSWMDPTNGIPQYAHPPQDHYLHKNYNVYFCYHPSYGSRGNNIDVFKIPHKALGAILEGEPGPVPRLQEAGHSDPPHKGKERSLQKRNQKETCQDDKVDDESDDGNLEYGVNY